MEIATRIRGGIDRFAERLMTPVDASAVIAFRWFFGALMAGDAFYKIYSNIDRYYSPEKFHLTYPGFDWVAPLPGIGMQLLILVMAFAALGIMFGCFYRASAVIYLLTYTYVFLIERTTYNNHYYFIILLGMIFVVIDAHAGAAADNFRRPETRTGMAPFWNVFLLRAQILVIYFFGGVAKLNGDWLRGEPMRHWLSNRADYPIVGAYFQEEWCVYLFTLGGLFGDVSIGFLLLWMRTRLWALLPLVFFHLTNRWLFTIGSFPILALGCTVIFFQPEELRRGLARLGFVISGATGSLPEVSKRRRSIIVYGVTGFLLLQCLLPFRHFLYPGNPSWTEEGHAFAWHMKLRDKKVRGTFRVEDPVTGKVFVISKKQQLNELRSTQRNRMLARPQLILQYAHHLRDRFKAVGVPNPRVYADVEASLNGRAFQPLVDPTVDLARETYSNVWPAPWIMPLDSDLPIGLYP